MTLQKLPEPIVAMFLGALTEPAYQHNRFSVWLLESLGAEADRRARGDVRSLAFDMPNLDLNETAESYGGIFRSAVALEALATSVEAADPTRAAELRAGFEFCAEMLGELKRRGVALEQWGEHTGMAN